MSATTTADRPKRTKAPRAPKAGAPTPATTTRWPRAAIRATADLLKLVSDPTRLHILLYLSGGSWSVTEMCQELGRMSQPAVSHHLALLRTGRLIEADRDGKHNRYHLTVAGQDLARAIKAIGPPS